MQSKRTVQRWVPKPPAAPTEPIPSEVITPEIRLDIVNSDDEAGLIPVTKAARNRSLASHSVVQRSSFTLLRVQQQVEESSKGEEEVPST